ncbi:MAG: hypothetical protein K0S49_2467, partial [Microbacterium sp.]|nr:hypothetical protein [Microbacterium sp.]
RMPQSRDQVRTRPHHRLRPRRPHPPPQPRPPLPKTPLHEAIHPVGSAAARRRSPGMDLTPRTDLPRRHTGCVLHHRHGGPATGWSDRRNNATRTTTILIVRAGQSRAGDERDAPTGCPALRARQQRGCARARQHRACDTGPATPRPHIGRVAPGACRTAPAPPGVRHRGVRHRARRRRDAATPGHVRDQRVMVGPNKRAIGASTAGRAATHAPTMTPSDSTNSQKPVQLSA